MKMMIIVLMMALTSTKAGTFTELLAKVRIDYERALVKEREHARVDSIQAVADSIERYGSCVLRAIRRTVERTTEESGMIYLDSNKYYHSGSMYEDYMTGNLYMVHRDSRGLYVVRGGVREYIVLRANLIKPPKESCKDHR